VQISKGRGCVHAIFTIHKKLEKRRNLPTYLLFIDYKKAYENLNCDKLWKMLTEDTAIPS
jgi:hypothetical protein